MGTSSSDKEQEIIALTYASPGFAHAERILQRLESLKRDMPHREAVDMLHSEVTDPDWYGKNAQPNPAKNWRQ